MDVSSHPHAMADLEHKNFLQPFDIHGLGHCCWSAHHPTLGQVTLYSYLQSIEWSIGELCVHKHMYSASQISMRPRTSHVPNCNHCQCAPTAAVPNLNGTLEPGSSTVSSAHANFNLIRKKPSTTCDRSDELMNGCSNPMYDVSDGPAQPAIWQSIIQMCDASSVDMLCEVA